MAKQILGKVQGPAGYSPKVELDKTGDTLTISVQNEDGTVSESIKTGEPVQSNWSVTNPDSLAYILNKPNLGKVATSNSYVDLDDKPTNLNQFTNGPGYITAASVPTKLSELTGDTTHRLVTDTEKASWDAKMDGGTTHLIGDVPTSRTVNGKALTNDITLTAEDVGALGSDTVIPEVSDVYSKTSSVAMSGKAVASAIADLVGTAPATLDTLGEIADALNKDTEGGIVNSIMTAIGEKQDALATQTVYNAKGSATKVSQITTNALGQVTKIAEVNIALPSTMTGASASANGAAGLVPAPGAGNQEKFLRGDGTWQEVKGGSDITYCSQATYDGTSGTNTNNILYFIN